MTCGAQFGALQSHGTCWLYSIINGFILSEDGQKILYQKLTEFYNDLSENEKAFFDDSINAPCPVNSIAKTKPIYFWKFTDQYLCALSGPRSMNLKAGKSVELLRNVSLVGNLARRHGGLKAAHPQQEFSAIMQHLGFKYPEDFVRVAYIGKENFHTKHAKFIMVSPQSSDPGIVHAMEPDHFPRGALKNKNYKLMSASITIGNTKEKRYHAISGFTCGGKGYIFDSNQREVFDCNFWNAGALNKTLAKVAAYYDYLCRGQMDYKKVSFYVFARRDYVSRIAPSCRMKYKVKTPNVPNFNFSSPNAGKYINHLSYRYNPAQIAAIKRKWARTEKKKYLPVSKNTLNKIIENATSYANGMLKLNDLKVALYKPSNENRANFSRRLSEKFRIKIVPLANVKAQLNKFSGATKKKRVDEYKRVWRTVATMAERRVLMKWRDTGNWPGGNNSPNRQSPNRQRARTARTARTAQTARV